MIQPHFDRWLKYSPNQNPLGWREGWKDRLIANCPKNKAAKAGYLGALYALRAETTPPAHYRQADTDQFQFQLADAIGQIEGGAI